MHSTNSGLAVGTSKSPQTTFEQQEYSIKVAEAEYQAIAHQNYLKEELPKTSPIHIPRTAIIKEEQKTGYQQVKYSWRRGEFKYLCRWHTRTPGAPPEQENTWVVERKLFGIGHDPNARAAKIDILYKKTSSGKNIWVSSKKWHEAIRARKNGTATKKQEELLHYGHWKA